MLTEKEREEIEEQIGQCHGKRGAIGEALRIVQRHRLWISDESLRDVADFLELTEEEVEHVATFYSLIFRRPVGRHVIQICDSVSCWIMGYRPLLEHLRGRLGNIQLGETTRDDRFTLLPVGCLGACDQAPALMIDEDLHTCLTAETIDRILEKYT